jgi:cell division protein FtsW
LQRSSENSLNSIATPRVYASDAGSGSVFGLWILPLILSTFGVVVISTMTGWSLSSPGLKQAIWFVVALGAFIVVTQIPLRFWYRYSPFLLIMSLGLMVLTIASPLRVTVKGASRWLRLGPVNFQPLEVVSLMMMIFFSRFYNRIRNMWMALIITGLIFAPFALVTMKQPDFGGLLMLGGIVGALFVEKYGFLLPILGAGALSPVLWYLANYGYRAERIATWLDPWTDPLGSGYQVIQGLIAFANGRVWGIGLGRGQQFLPEIHNDFIFPAIGEQFGFIVTGTIFMLFLFWTLCVFSAYKRALPERRIAIWGCCVAVLLPFFINLGGVMKIIPLTGMPLPFISYGGTSLVFMWVRIGFLIRLIKEPEEDD